VYFFTKNPSESQRYGNSPGDCLRNHGEQFFDAIRNESPECMTFDSFQSMNNQDSMKNSSRIARPEVFRQAGFTNLING
jgi:hypothetical protein